MRQKARNLADRVRTMSLGLSRFLVGEVSSRQRARFFKSITGNVARVLISFKQNVKHCNDFTPNALFIIYEISKNTRNRHHRGLKEL